MFAKALTAPTGSFALGTFVVLAVGCAAASGDVETAPSSSESGEDAADEGLSTMDEGGSMDDASSADEAATNTDSGPSSDDAGDDTGDSGDSGDSGDTGDTGDTGEPGGLVEYYGRFDLSVADQATFDWPGAYIEAGSTGSTLGVEISGPAGTYFDVFIDGEKVPPINGPGGVPPAFDHGTFRLYDGVDSYEIATGLAATAHTIRLVKRSETMWSPVVFKGFQHGDGAPSNAPDRPGLKIEFIGDSYTAGYGVESPSKTDPDSQDESGRACSAEELLAYTNTDMAYGAIAGRALGAQYQVNAYSGLGMVRHYDGSTAFLPFEEYYASTLESQPGATWDFSSWVPDVVVLSLGRNDFSTPLGPNDAGIYLDRDDLIAKYKVKYREFLDLLRQRYPGVQIVNVASNLWPDDEFRPAVLDVIALEEAEGATDLHYHDFFDEGGFGCGWHPHLATQESLGQDLADLIDGIL